jgi:hypothetical protein
MPGWIAVILFVVAVAPLVCLVDFAFHRGVARQAPSSAWVVAWLLPWALLVTAAASQVRALLPLSFVLAGLVAVAWLIRRTRGR